MVLPMAFFKRALPLFTIHFAEKRPMFRVRSYYDSLGDSVTTFTNYLVARTLHLIRVLLGRPLRCID